MLESSCNPDVVQVHRVVGAWSCLVFKGVMFCHTLHVRLCSTLYYTCASHIRPPYRFQGAPVQTLKVCSYVFIHSTGIQQDMQEQAAFNKNH